MPDHNFGVLVVDDHPLMRDGLCAAIRAEPGLRVVGVAASGSEAVSAFRTLLPDVALIDQRLPDMDGTAVTAAIKREFPMARVVIISSFDTDEDVGRAFAAGAASYVLKDAPPSEVVRLVREAAVTQHKIVPGAVAPVLAAHSERATVSSRERALLRHLAEGLSNRQIGDSLGISENTVRFHMKSLFLKLDVEDRTRAVVVGLQRGIIKLGDITVKPGL